MSAAERFGARRQIRLSQMSMFNTPPRPSVMAMLKGYADDSRPNNRIWAIAGYVGNDLKWEAFEERWAKLLKVHGVPYFHMKELGQPNGAYAKWHPLKEHQAEIDAFFRDITTIISDCWLSGFWSIVRIADLERFNAEKGLRLEPYPLAAYGCILAIAQEFGDLTSEIFFDRVEKVHSKLEKAEAYAGSDTHWGEALGNVGLFPLQKNVTWRELTPLQAADFFTWELQRNHLGIDEWHALSGRPLDQDEREEHFKNWSLEKFNAEMPTPRKSLEAIMKRAAPVSGFLWDYDNLCMAHNLRGGVWFRS
jgi:hypothetical protein